MYKLTFFEKLTLKYGLEGKYFEKAEGIISAKNRELDRKLTLDEAAIILAEEGSGQHERCSIKSCRRGCQGISCLCFS